MSTTDGSPYDRDHFNPNIWLKAQAAAHGVPKKQLLAMSEPRDPFNFGTPADWEKAEWFLEQHERFGMKGLHLRRLHYRISNLGEGQILLWDGTPYENNNCWGKLIEAFTAARILGLVDAGDFTERRVKASRVDSYEANGKPELSFEVEAPPLYELPDAPYSVVPELIGDTDLTLYRPTISVAGYEYSADLQPTLVKVWDEKSGDTDLMRSLAYRHGINYQPGVGYASITNIKLMLRRVASYGKPARILYVSDHDPAGQNMPIQVGRHSQFSCWELTEVAQEVAPEIMIDNAALTAEDVERLDLPTFTNSTKVEIDALEALHPGELERILTSRITELQDGDLRRKVSRARMEAQSKAQSAVDEVMEHHSERLEEIESEASEIVERYNALYQRLGEQIAERYRRLGERYERHISSLKEQAEQEHAAIEEELESLQVDLPQLPEPELDDTGDWLFDSRRDFLDQTRRFRRAKGWS